MSRSAKIRVNKKIDYNRIPQHIAFIMDGNGRWAQKRGLLRLAGHKAGAQSMLKVVKRCLELGIKYVSFYAFSTENWKRPDGEVNGIFDEARKLIAQQKDEFVKNGVRVVTMGDTTKFPKDMQDSLKQIVDITRRNDRITLNIAINYGGRAEIINAVNRILSEKKIKSVDEQIFEEYLYTGIKNGDFEGKGITDPDLLVRTSGESRISNFMLYQIAYSELYFTKVFWPMVGEKFVDECVIEFQKRKRRYGAV